MEGEKSIPAVRDITVTEEQQMEIVTSASCVKDPSDDDVPKQHKSDVIVENNKKVTSDQDDKTEAGDGGEKEMESEGLELSIADVSSVSMSNYSVSETENKGEDVNTFDDSATLPLSQAEDKKQEKVKCPYCDFEFEEFSSDAFSEHLRTVHCITKSLDILLEFSLNTIKKGNKQIRDVCVDVSCNVNPSIALSQTINQQSLFFRRGWIREA